MIAKLIIASLLAGTATASVGQDVGRPTADGSTSQWPHMHQCTLEAASKLAIKTKGTGAQRSRVGGESDSAGWSRIDLQLAGPADGPTISAYAINTKGTGSSSGRMSSDFAINTKGTGTSSGRAGVTGQSPIGVECVKSEITGGEAAQKAAAAAFTFMSADGKGPGWSCSVSGSEDEPVFRVSLLVPTILGQAEKSASWSWGVSNGRLSIVPRSAENSESWHVACSSKEPRNTNYDLAVLKKA